MKILSPPPADLGQTPPPQRVLSVILVGYGFMGKTHARCLARISGVRIAAIVERRGEVVREELAAEKLQIPVFSEISEAVAAGDCDAVIICLPTDGHCSAVAESAALGKPIFLEKPLARTPAEGTQILAHCAKAGVPLMVGHVLHYWPEYRELERRIRCGSDGRLLSLGMSRRSGRPAYTVEGWINDPHRCAGAALDLHIHDTEWICTVLGMPQAVFSRGVHMDSGWDYLHTHYVYEAPCVHAEGGWELPCHWGFRMTYQAVFEAGVLDFDSTSPHPLRWTGHGIPPASVSLDAPSETPPVAYRRELEAFLASLRTSSPRNSGNGAAALRALEVVHAEIRSAETGRPVVLKPSSI